MTPRRSARLFAEAGGDTWLHVCRDDGRMSRFAAALAFFHPELNVLSFPAWDCLPYDRVSPNGEITSRRIDTLTRLAAGSEQKPLVVLTTVNALVQRVPPRNLFDGRVLTLGPGGRIPLDRLQSFFRNNGYIRTDTVREPGEFAVRGGIVDLFPAGAAQPIRLDFFGDTLESLRSFDPLTQRSTGALDKFVLRPVSEILLDDAAIQRFRSRYREQFGAIGSDDPLYELVSAGRRHAGMEHWLPLYYETLETLFDYLPKAAVSLDHQAEEARCPPARTRSPISMRRGRALPPSPAAPLRYIARSGPSRCSSTTRNGKERLRAGAVVRLSPFAAPDEGGADSFDAGARPAKNFATERANPNVNLFDAVREYLDAERKAGRHAAIAAYSEGSADRLATVLREHGLADLRRIADGAALARLPHSAVGLAILPLEQGFTTDSLILLGEQDILGDRLARAPRRRRNLDDFITEAAGLSSGDLVVHAEHGIGRYEALETIDVAGAPHDCLKVLYAGDDRLFVPVENIEVLSRYGSEEAGAQLDRLGGVAWQSRKARVKQRIREIAGELIRVAAERQLRPGETLVPPEGLYAEFAARFPYPETEDQLRAIEETLSDLAAGKPMDRLVCGDVGFGKTEVALRAAFIAAFAGAQVAVIVPTTLLARQHFRSFSERFAGLPVRVAQLSRLVSPKEAKQTKAELAEGKIDIVIGTHALLAKDVRFAHLGLVVVDEEQHFGVEAEGAAEAVEGRRACADADRDADPAHLAAGAVGRARDEHHRDSAGRPAGGAHLCDAVRSRRDPRGDPARARPRRADLLCRAAHLRSRRSAPGIAKGRARDPRRDGARPDAGERARRRHDRVRRARLRCAAVDQHHRVGPRHPDREHVDRAPRRHVRAGAALSTARPHRAQQIARLRLPDTAREEEAGADGAAPPRRHADPGYARRRLPAGEPRSRHPRRRQSARRRAVRPYPRGRHRALPAHAGGGGRGGAQRRRGRHCARGMDAADHDRHAGADPGEPMSPISACGSGFIAASRNCRAGASATLSPPS